MPMRKTALILTVASLLGAQSFEVVSIKPHPPAIDQPVFKNPDRDFQIAGGRIELPMVSLRGLVEAAYAVREDQVTGIPAWAQRPDARWDVVATLPAGGPSDRAAVRQMLQAMLADRFALKLHPESKVLPVFVLTAPAAGLRLAAATDAPPASGMRRGTLPQLAALLSVMLQRPVLDQTGLTGAYDYGANLLTLDVGAGDSQEVSARVIAAVHAQLGLKLNAARRPVQLLVIDAARPPTAN